MNSIAFDVENEKRFSSRIQTFFKRYQVSSILKKCNYNGPLVKTTLEEIIVNTF